MSRFYVPKEKVKDGYILIDGQEAKHAVTVMRLKESDKVIVFDGTAKEYFGVIEEITKNNVKVKIIKTKELKISDNIEITLVQAIPKKDKMDYIVEKATELGVKTIIPVISKRTVVVFDDNKKQARHSRWEKIALSAAKQCGRTDVPTVSEIIRYEDVFKKIDEYDICLFAWLSEDTLDFKKCLEGFIGKKIMIFIGPEGDFTLKEATAIKEFKNTHYVSLGKRVLRSDTAGLYMISCLNYQFG